MKPKETVRLIKPWIVLTLAVIFIILFVLGARKTRLVLLAFFLLPAGIGLLFTRRKALGMLTVFSVFLLYLCTAPGILAEEFHVLERVRFSFLRPAYERHLDTVLEEAGSDTRWSRAEQVPRLISDDICYHKENEHIWVLYVTEFDKYCGYMWCSDEEALESTAGFDEVRPAGDSWYYVKVFPFGLRQEAAR